MESMSNSTTAIDLWSPVVCGANWTAPDTEQSHIIGAVLLVGVYGVLLLVTVTGNLLVIAAFFKDPQLQAIANYWIVSLSFTDVTLACTVLPLQIMRVVQDRWTLGELACDLFIMMDVLSCTCSIYHLMLISLDRYLCVCFPIRYTTFRTSSRTILAVFCTWLWCAVISSPRLFGWKDKPNPNLHCNCEMTSQTYMVFSSLVSFYVPLFLIMCMYIGIYRWTQKRTKKFQRANKSSATGSSRRMRASMKLNKLTGTVGELGPVAPPSPVANNNNDKVQNVVEKLTADETCKRPNGVPGDDRGVKLYRNPMSTTSLSAARQKVVISYRQSQTQQRVSDDSLDDAVNRLVVEDTMQSAFSDIITPASSKRDYDCLQRRRCQYQHRAPLASDEHFSSEDSLNRLPDLQRATSTYYDLDNDECDIQFTTLIVNDNVIEAQQSPTTTALTTSPDVQTHTTPGLNPDNLEACGTARKRKRSTGFAAVANLEKSNFVRKITNTLRPPMLALGREAEEWHTRMRASSSLAESTTNYDIDSNVTTPESHHIPFEPEDMAITHLSTSTQMQQQHGGHDNTRENNNNNDDRTTNRVRLSYHSVDDTVIHQAYHSDRNSTTSDSNLREHDSKGTTISQSKTLDHISTIPSAMPIPTTAITIANPAATGDTTQTATGLRTGVSRRTQARNTVNATDKGTAANGDALERKKAAMRRTLTRRRQRQDNRTARVVVIVIGAFVIFWTPFFFLNVFDPITRQLFDIDQLVPPIIWSWATLWGYANSAINPFIYTFFNRTFRRAIENVVTCSKNTQQRY